MTRRWPPVSSLVMLLLGVLLVGQWARDHRRLAPPSIRLATSLPAPGANAVDEPWIESPTSIQGVARSVRRAHDLRGALESLRRQYSADAPILHSLTEEVRVACAIVRRPDASAWRVENDPNRRFWIDELLRRCAGLLDSDLAPPAPSAAALAQWNQQLPLIAAIRVSLEAGVELAGKHVASSTDPRLIADSLRFLLDQGRLPLAQVFSGVQLPPQADIEESLIYAADWIGCLRADACAADGLWTLYTCAQFGCPAGSDLPRALYRILPAQHYEIARRIVQWANAR